MANSDSILAIDIGGSHIKATILDASGNFLREYEREKTPQPATPLRVIELIKKLASRFPEYDRITAGFPGYVRNGVVKTAPKLGNTAWKNYDLQKKLSQVLGRPAIVINDADLQGLSLATGKGVEMIITLGTGFGSALLKDGHLLPHLEMSVHPFTSRKTYNEYVGEEALQKIGPKKWNKRMKKVITVLKRVFNYDHLYISGGNSQLLSFAPGRDVTIADNKQGIRGGAIIWQQQQAAAVKETVSIK